MSKKCIHIKWSDREINLIIVAINRYGPRSIKSVLQDLQTQMKYRSLDAIKNKYHTIGIQLGLREDARKIREERRKKVQNVVDALCK